MVNWITVADAVDIPTNSCHEVDIENISILIVNVNGLFYAIENLCTHDGGTLSDGNVEGDEIICPRHGARFCIKTGAVTAPPAYEDIKTFPLRVENGKILIDID